MSPLVRRWTWYTVTLGLTPNSPGWLNAVWWGGVCAACATLATCSLTGSVRSHYSSCLASILDREIKGKGALLRSRLDGMQRWSKITFVEYCALFCLCWLVVFYMAWSISGTYCWGIHMLKYKCRRGFYEQWTKVSKFTDQKKLLPQI